MHTDNLPFGGITISKQAIESAATRFTLDCYGVASIADLPAKNVFDDLFKSEPKHGVVAYKRSGSWNVNVHINVIYGLKLTEIISGVQAQVKYMLEQVFDIKFNSINIYIEGLEVPK